MEDEENKMGLDQTMDAFNYANMVLDKLKEHKDDDGKIDAAEIGSTFVSTFPAGVMAYAGSDQIDDEMKDLNSDEVMQMAMEGAQLMKKILSLFMGETEFQKK